MQKAYWRFTFVWILVMLSPGTLFCQNYEVSFENISTHNGLVDNNIHCILQDSKGFMWFGSEEGLHRYDGYSMRVFRHDPGNQSGLSNNQIKALYEDHYNRLWIGTDGGGITIFDLQTETFSYLRYEADSPESSLISDDVFCFAGSADGNLWVGTKQGLDFVEIAPRSKENSLLIKSIHHYRHHPDNDNSLAYPHVYSVLEDKQGTLWAGTTEGGLSRLDKGAESFINYRPNNQPGSISGTAIMTIYEDSHGHIWFGTWAKGLNLYDRDKNVFKTIRHNPRDTTSLSHDNIYSLCEDNLGHLWVGTYDGGLNQLIHTPGKKLKFKRYQARENELKSFFKNKVKVIYPDRSGILWAGTMGNGVNKILSIPINFRHITNKAVGETVATINKINSFASVNQRDTFLLGTQEGLFRMTKNSMGTGYEFEALLKDSTQTPNLFKKSISAVFRDKQRNLWVGTQNQGIMRFSFEKDALTSFLQYSPYKAAPFNLSGRNVIRVFNWHERLWVVTERSINVFDSKEQRFVWSHPDGTPLFDIDGSISSVWIDPQQRIWVGTKFNGLYGFEIENNQLDQIKQISHINEDTRPLRLSAHQVYSIGDAYDDKLWVGTAKGLHLIDPIKGSNVVFKEKDGLPSSAVTQIYKDKHGYFWFGTLQGLARYDVTNNLFSSFFMPGGFMSNYFVPGLVTEIDQQQVYLPTNNGIWEFNPDSIKRSPFHAEPVITDFRIAGQRVTPNQPVNNRVLLEQVLSSTEHLTLRHDENVLQLEFSALTYFKQDQNKFKYKLDGLEEKWNYTDAQHRSVTYSNLSPGNYTFRLQAANNDGIWNPDEATFSFTINPPYYRTWWAYLAYSLLGIGLFILIQRFTVQRVRFREKLKREQLAREKETALNQMKLRFFTNVSHEFRTPLTLIAGPLEEILSEPEAIPATVRKQLDMMKGNTDRLLRLINQLMDFRKVMQGNMKLTIRQREMTAFIHRIADSFKGIAAQKHIHYHVEICNQSLLVWFDTEKVETIVFNLLSNAFKFTPEGGEIKLSLEPFNAREVKIRVTDSGPGIPAEDKPKIFDRFYQVEQHQQHAGAGTGVGLSLVRDFTESHKGNIHILDNTPKGTCFEVVLSVAKESFKKKEILEDEVSIELIPQSTELASEPAGENKTNPELIDKPKILIVEDQPDVRTYVRGLLEKEYRVEEAGNGLEGLEKATSTLPELIISDVMMPEMDGFMFCEKLRKNVITSHIPIVMLTALDGVESRLESLETGADAYVVKPFNKQILLTQVKNLLNSRRHLKERFKEQWDFVEEIATTSADKQFVNRAVKLVEENMGDPRFNVSEMVKKMNVSRTLLHMKLRELTGQSTSEFIRTIRLKQAAKLLKQGELNVSEVTYHVGFNDPKYFSKSFKGLFGVTPTAFQKGDASGGDLTMDHSE